jgi:acyl-CoA synthetase (AMP-forming)/AMP-acid ligase II
VIELLAARGPKSAAILEADSEVETSYEQLANRIAFVADALKRELGRGLVFLVTGNTADCIVTYLACLEAKCPVCLIEAGLVDQLVPLIEAYQPDAIVVQRSIADAKNVPGVTSFQIGSLELKLQTPRSPDRQLHSELALLLMTSGSTGSPKTVRLTRENLVANARSIAEYLSIVPGERAIQSLPMHYSYGLSLVNSHLIAGAAIVLTGHSFKRPEFWTAFDATECTSFAGVPYVYETLDRLRFDPARHPSLRTLTQAGGGLRPGLVEKIQERSTAANCRFFVMYGQTEATARISYVPYQQLDRKIGSIGVAIPGGVLSLQDVDDADEKELVYEGPNVMMGYAESSHDLASGDLLRGRLQTGDLARVDDDGYYFLTGRLTRIAKLFGKRFSLDDVEKGLESKYAMQAAVVERDGKLQVFSVCEPDMDSRSIGKDLAQSLNVPPQCITIVELPELPRTVNGKKDYRSLTREG